MSNLYPDLENKFPEQVDDFEKFQDPTIDSISLINQYYSYSARKCSGKKALERRE